MEQHIIHIGAEMNMHNGAEIACTMEWTWEYKIEQTWHYKLQQNCKFKI